MKYPDREHTDRMADARHNDNMVTIYGLITAKDNVKWSLHIFLFRRPRPYHVMPVSHQIFLRHYASPFPHHPFFFLPPSYLLDMTVPHPTQPTVTQAPTQATTTSDAQPVTQGVNNSSSPPLDDSSQASKRRKVTGHMGYMRYVFIASCIYAAILTQIQPFLHRDDEYVKYYKLGKLIPRMVHPFLPIHQLLYYGSRLYMLENSEGGDYDPSNKLNML